LIIFDCDGVLVDSEVIANEVLKHALCDYGLPLTTAQVIETFVGRSMAYVVEKSQHMLGHDLPVDFLDRLQEKTFAAFRNSLKPVAGIQAVLNSLSDRPQKTCVASSGSFEKMDLTLELTGIRHFFEGRIFNSSQVKRGKPYPDLFLHAAEQMDVDPSRCLVVEDSLPGVQGAVAAGMEVLAYAVRGQGKNLATAGGMVFSDMAEILKHIE
jgi:HAD superfamily hydrolase (TIGR01509 family)